MRSWLGLVVLGTVGIVGCAGSPGESGDEEGGPALVMLDAEARASGFSIVTDEGKQTPVTPIEIEGNATLVGPGQRIPLSGAPGELLVVTGKRGALVSHTLGSEVDSDAARVNGDEKSVRSLAASLHAKVTGEGPWELRAPGVFASLAHQKVPEGVRTIEAVDTESQEKAQQGAIAIAEANQAMAFSPNDPRFASFGPLGAHAPVCQDAAAGTWVSAPKFSPIYQDWHVFTMHVETGATSSELTGTVKAHVWSGGADEAAPVECEGNDMDYHVSMPAKGVRSEGGAVRFDSGPWKLESSCVPNSWGYNPDHFSGVLEGGAIRSVNNDGGRAVDDPVGFERVSCE